MTKAAKKEFPMNTETFINGANEAMKEHAAKMNGYLSSLQTMSKEFADVLKASGTRSAKGVADHNAEVQTFTKAAIEASVENAKALANVKSIDEAVKLQSAYLSGRVEATTAWFKTLSEISQASWKESVEPLTEAAKGAAKKAGSLAA